MVHVLVLVQYEILLTYMRWHFTGTRVRVRLWNVCTVEWSQYCRSNVLTKSGATLLSHRI